MTRGSVIILVIVLGTMVFGCSSSKEVKEDDTFLLAAFEDFDPDEHPDVVLPPPPSEIEHAIPEAFLTPREAGVVKVRGYRVQLYASRDKREADAQLRRAINWWEVSGASDEDRDYLPVYLEYEQPYYKVRLGDYRDRERAASDADRLARIFRGAFVVPAWVNSQ